MTSTKKVKSPCEISETLKERGHIYGEFIDNAQTAQALKSVLRSAKAYNGLPDDMRESLEMICHKLARVVNGNFNHKDTWVDVAGYSKLIADRLRG